MIVALSLKTFSSDLCRKRKIKFVCASPTPVAARSKVWVFGCSLAGIAGSKPGGGMEK